MSKAELDSIYFLTLLLWLSFKPPSLASGAEEESCLPSATLASLESTPFTWKPERSLNINQMGSFSCSKHLSACCLALPAPSHPGLLSSLVYFCLRVFAILFPPPAMLFPTLLAWQTPTHPSDGTLLSQPQRSLLLASV